MRINEIKSETKNLVLIARVEKVILSTGNNGSNYLVVYLVDKTGRVEARLWNCDDADYETIKADSVIKIEAVVNVYRQQIQLKINTYEVLKEEDFHKYDITEETFSISAPINVEMNFKVLMEFLEKLTNETYKKITMSIIKEYEDEFKTYPAATSIHHNVVGGLFWHSFSLLMAAKGLKEVYRYAEIDWELVYCGTLLHDIGKVVEMKGKRAAEYTDEGKLLGHISIGNTFISLKEKELNIDPKFHNEVVKLQHVILSSHGKNEFGSPVEPVLIEGIIISSLDALDARIYKVNEELMKVENSGWSSRIMTEDGRSFLRHYKK